MGAVLKTVGSVKGMGFDTSGFRMKESICKQCGNTIVSRYNRDFCDNNCRAAYTHKMCYKDFLKNPEKYCKGNYTPKNFRNEFLNEQDNKCAICGCTPVWNGKPLVFILDHIDGDASNNRRENLRMICPNCDSQLETFKSKNKNSTRRNYWREHLIKSLSESYKEIP